MDGRRGREVGLDGTQVDPPLGKQTPDHFSRLAADRAAEKGALTELAEHSGDPETLAARVEMNLGRPVLLAGLDRDCEAHNGGEYRHRVLVMTQWTPFPRFCRHSFRRVPFTLRGRRRNDPGVVPVPTRVTTIHDQIRTSSRQ